MDLRKAKWGIGKHISQERGKQADILQDISNTVGREDLTGKRKWRPRDEEMEESEAEFPNQKRKMEEPIVEDSNNLSQVEETYLERSQSRCWCGTVKGRGA